MYKPTPNFLAVLTAVVALVCFVGLASAQTVPTDLLKITYVNATLFVDGGVIPAPPDPTSLKGVRIQRSIAATCSTGSFGTVEETINLNVPATSFTFNALRPAGKHCVRLASVLLNGDVGPWSPVLFKNIVLPAPPKAQAPSYTVE